LPDPQRIVVLGHVTGAFGVAGWVKVEPYTETSDALLQFQEWWLKAPRGTSWRSMKVKAARVHGDSVIAQLGGLDDRDAALALKGSELGVLRELLPAAQKDEIYWSDLVGLSVVNREGRTLGQVKGITAHGAHPLLQVVGEGESTERLIPYVPAVIDAIDVEAGRIEVDWGEDY
jgi:16S rRNA processing protein RimM